MLLDHLQELLIYGKQWPTCTAVQYGLSETSFALSHAAGKAQTICCLILTIMNSPSQAAKSAIIIRQPFHPSPLGTRKERPKRGYVHPAVSLAAKLGFTLEGGNSMGIDRKAWFS